MKNVRNLTLEHTYTIWAIVLILWAVYRVYFKFPEWVDEILVKPAIFLGPMCLYVLRKEKRTLTSVGLAGGKLFRDLYVGIGFGMLFALEGLVANSIKYGKFSFAPLLPLSGAGLWIVVVLAIVTAFSEELLVRGFLYTRLKEGYRSEVKAMVVSAAMYLLLLIPFIFTVSHISGVTLLVFLLTNLVMSFANTMIFSETKTLTVPVLIHAFWNMAVALYL